MQKIFNGILLIIFLVLVTLFAYKTLKTPEVSKASVTNTLATDDKTTNQNLAETKSSEEELNNKIQLILMVRYHMC